MSQLVYLYKSKNNSENNIINENNLYYFDFEINKWCKCYQMNSHPYNLYEFKLEDNDKTIMTCQDSYRIIDNLENAPSNEEMYQEKEWRDQIAEKNIELDLYQKGEWHKMKVAWIKNELINDVLHLVPRRRNLNNNHLCCYIYKEDKNIAKSCTHTRIITEEELNKEKEMDTHIKNKIEHEKCQALEIQKLLKLYKVKESYYHFYDILPYYQKLKTCIHDKLMEKELFKNDETYQKYILGKNYEKCLTYLVFHSLKNNIDVASIFDEYTVDDSYVKLDKYDGFYNITIHNATYAKLISQGIEIEADIISDVNENKKIFGFNDIHEQNPLFASSLAILRIHTDGDKITFNGIVINSFPRKIILYSQYHTYTHFTSKKFILMDSNGLYSSQKINYDMLEETTNKYYKLNV